MAVEEGLQLSYDGMKFTPLSSPSYTNSVSAHQTGLYAAGVFNLAPRESKYRPFFLIGPEFVWYGPPKIGNLSAGAGSPALILPTNSLTTTGRTALTYGIGLKINEANAGLSGSTCAVRAPAPRTTVCPEWRACPEPCTSRPATITRVR